MTRRVLVAFLLAPTFGVALACSGLTVAVGSPPGADASTSADADPTSDVVTTPPRDAFDTGTSEDAIPVGLSVDGIRCRILREDGRGGEWPDFGFYVSAECGALGAVSLILDSNASISYPQTCSVATTLLAAVGLDAGMAISSFEASSTRGSCSVLTGPNPAVPATAISLRATVAHYQEASLTHEILYRAATGGSGTGSDGGPGFDANTGIDTGNGYDAHVPEEPIAFGNARHLRYTGFNPQSGSCFRAVVSLDLLTRQLTAETCPDGGRFDAPLESRTTTISEADLAEIRGLLGALRTKPPPGGGDAGCTCCDGFSRELVLDLGPDAGPPTRRVRDEYICSHGEPPDSFVERAELLAFKDRLLQLAGIPSSW